MKLIAFSLWGHSPGYVVGAVSNIKLAPLYYPDWECRIYVSTDVPHARHRELRDAGFEVYQRGPALGSLDGLFWRFEPAFEPGVEAFISRDLDSRLNPREAAAVSEWLESGKKLHTMRDHYEHIVPILGGMWGCRHWPEFEKLLANWKQRSRMGDDQEFLKQVIWPLVKENDCIQHDCYTVDTTVDTPKGTFTYKPVEFFGGNNLRPFPSHAPLDKNLGEHVGARVWE